jgi:folate-binding protein YgfZ
MLHYSLLKPVLEAHEFYGSLGITEASLLLPYKEMIAQSLKNGSLVFDLSTRGKVEVVGPEAGIFLHNLCTNEVIGMPIGAGIEAFFANSRARVVAWANIFHVLLSRGRDGFWIDLPHGMEDEFIRHLDRHLISEQVEFSDRSHEFCQVHLMGPRCKVILASILETDLPQLTRWQHMERNIGDALCHIRRVDWLGSEGYDIVFLAKHGSIIVKNLLECGAKFACEQIWDELRIAACLPKLGNEINDSVFIPELRRNAISVSGTKGCYIGQEPIVMARDRGQINKKLILMKIDGSGNISSGSSLNAHGKEIGKITSISKGITGNALALGFVKKELWEPGKVVDCFSQDQHFKVTVLPFADL